MSSKINQLCDHKCERIPFRLSALNRSVPDKIGVYGFWFRDYCVYIGMTETQSLHTRLLNHWEGTHNKVLRLWISAKRDNLVVAFLTADDPHQAACYERYFIHIFHPLTNKLLYT